MADDTSTGLVVDQSEVSLAPPRKLPASRAAGSNVVDASEVSLTPPGQPQPGTAGPTISTYEPSWWERTKAAFGAGAPQGSRLANWTQQVGTTGSPQLITPEAAMTPLERERHPIATGLAEVAGGLTSPENVAIMAGTGGLGRLPGAAGKLPRLVSAYFTEEMLRGAYNQFPELKRAMDAGNESDAKRILTRMVTSGALAYLSGRHAAGLEPLPVLPERLAGTDTYLGRLATAEQAVRTAQRYGGTLERGPGSTVPPPGEQEAAQPRARGPIITPAPLERRALPPAGLPEEQDFLAGRPTPVPRLAGPPALGGLVEDVGPGVRPTMVDASEVSANPPYRLPWMPEPQPPSLGETRPDAARPTVVGAAEVTAMPPTLERGPAAEAKAQADALEKRVRDLIDKSSRARSGVRAAQLVRQAGELSAQARAIREQGGIGPSARPPAPEPGPTVGERAKESAEKWAAAVSEFPPDVLEDAKTIMGETSDYLGAQDRPGRYLVGEEDALTSAEREKRIGIPSARDLFPWFADLKESPAELARALEKGSGALHDRLLTRAADWVTAQRKAAAPVIREFEPELRRLAEATRDADPQISQTLTNIADGKYASATRLKDLIGRTIADANEIAEFSRAVDELSAAEREIPAGAAPGAEPAGAARGEAGILPGLEQAAVEQAQAAGELRGERLTEEVNRPPESIEAAAGELERTSRLFRGTEASPQKELFGKAGRLSAGIDPTLLRSLIPESVSREVQANRQARGLQAGLYDLESQNAADLIRAREAMKSAPGTPADQEAIYHHLEDPRVRLTPDQQHILDTAIRPMMEEAERIHAKLTEGGIPAENYVHRILEGKGSVLERILGGRGKVGAGPSLSTSAASARGRTMMALEDAEGTRRVVSIKGAEVTAFDQGQAESLGKLRGLETQGVKTREQILEREVAPMEREIDRLETERRTLTATKGRAESSARRIKNIENRLAELRQAVADAHLDVPESELQNRVFVDKDGHQWRITQATTREIEANTDLRYYKNALASSVTNYLSLRRAERAYDFLEQVKASPEFQEVAQKVGEGVAPAGWRTTDLPQFRGYAFEPHTAEVLDWYAKRMRGGEGPGLWTKIGQFLRTSIFFNPLIHVPNISVHWTVEKGVSGFLPQNWPTILRTGAKAINAVIHQNSDFLEALDAGAPLQSQHVGGDNITPLLLEKMGRELQGNRSAAARIANALGYANPAKLIRAVYNFSGRVTWTVNDIAVLQAAYEKTARGVPLREALRETSLHIPDYRLPTRIFDSPALAKLMSNPNLTMFGAYHYGALRSYGEMAKSLLGDVPLAERAKALDRVAMLGLVTYVLYPQADKLAKWLTGDPTAQFRRAGASTFLWNLQKLAQGERTPTDVLESVATPAVHSKSAVELATNRNLYTGRRIYDVHAPAGELAREVGGYAARTISPIQQASRVMGGERTPGQFIASLAGIKTPVRSQAEKRLTDYLSESAGTEAQTAQGRANAAERARLRQGLATGKLSVEDVRQSFHAGKIDRAQALGVLEDTKGGTLGGVRRLPLDKALDVWDVATPQERKQIAPLILEKARTFRTNDPQTRQKLIDRLRQVRGGSALPFLRSFGTEGQPQVPASLPFLQQQAPPPGRVALPFLRQGVPQ